MPDGRATSNRVCDSDVTLRDEEHRLCRCILPADHPGSHTDGQGATWTDHRCWWPDDDALRQSVEEQGMVGW